MRCDSIVRLEKNCNDVFAILSDIVFRIYHVNCKALNNSKFYWNRILRYKTKRRLRKRSIITKLVICLSRESWFCEVFYLVSETQCSNSKNTFLQTRRFMDRFTYPRYPSGRSSSSRCQRRNSRDPNRTQKEIKHGQGQRTVGIRWAWWGYFGSIFKSEKVPGKPGSILREWWNTFNSRYRWRTDHFNRQKCSQVWIFNFVLFIFQHKGVQFKRALKTKM